ncbi:MAG TPA: carboxypeptidase-like regulatory domain-containing protein [Gemmatimonadaceae bacterium]|nr:carboxypeptidase-like regulatory domain-containing protein [Gemmatimonadaceae bacterium]
MQGMQRAGRWSLAGVLLLMGLAVHPPNLSAQVVTGTVRDSASQLPLPGTRVVVVDPNGRASAQGTTDQLGRFRISPWTGRAARAGNTMRLRIVRMGFRPREIPLARAAATFDISIASFPVVLEEVAVTAAACPKRADRAATLTLLQQVRMALFASVLARSQSSGTMTRLLYERQLDGRSGRILGQSVRTKVTSATREPFTAARSAAAFNREGFVKDDAGGHTYIGPDAETLVDDAFSQQYCFKLNPPDGTRPGLTGLGFEPVYREYGRIDVVGTVWVDTLSRVLQDLTFRYVGLDPQTSALQPEGRLSFRELSNGVVIIDQWSLRLAGGRAQINGATPEIGGEIARASWPDGYSWSAPLGTIRLHAVDGQGRPASAASVQLVDTDYQKTVDSSGTVVLAGLLPGPYTANVRDPRLVPLGVASSTSVKFTAMRDSTKEALVEVESADDFVRKRCGQDLRGTGHAAILGRVVGTDGRPVREARFTIRDASGSQLVQDGRVDADGLFHWCQVPPNSRVIIDVWRDERRVNDSRIVMDRVTAVNFVLP